MSGIREDWESILARDGGRWYYTVMEGTGDRAVHTVYMYGPTYSRVCINRVRLPILLVVS